MEIFTRSIYKLEEGLVDSPFLIADFNRREQASILNLRGHLTVRMIGPAQIIMENANEITGSTDLCIVPATMPFDPNKYRVGTNPQAARYPHRDVGGEWQAEIERHTRAKRVYESNESDSDEDEETMEERGCKRQYMRDTY